MICRHFDPLPKGAFATPLAQPRPSSAIWGSRQNDSIPPEPAPCGLDGGDSMPVIQAEPKPVRSTVSADIPSMSDDECLRRLAKAVDEHDSGHLDEVALL